MKKAPTHDVEALLEAWEEVDSNHRTRRSGFTVRRNCHYAIFPIIATAKVILFFKSANFFFIQRLFSFTMHTPTTIHFVFYIKYVIFASTKKETGKQILKDV